MIADKTLEMKKMERRPGYVGPLILIAIGLILLFNRSGLLHLGIWWFLLHYWPVIFILWGIEILARHSESNSVYFAAVFLSIMLIIGTFFLAWTGYPSSEKTLDDLRWEIIFYNKTIFNYRFGDKELNFANLNNADFNNSNLNGANMNFASMRDANFSNSSLRGVNMNFAGLTKADLRNSVLVGANLNFANLDGANMAGARLTGANHVLAYTTKYTICPDSTNGPCW